MAKQLRKQKKKRLCGFIESAEAFGCEVHSFDPSIDYPEGKRSPGITFHHFGIGRNNHTSHCALNATQSLCSKWFRDIVVQH